MNEELKIFKNSEFWKIKQNIPKKFSQVLRA